MTDQQRVPTEGMRDFVRELFAAAGLGDNAARRVADALIEADASGRGSHGVLQADNYLAKLASGAMSTAEKPVEVSASGGVVVLDAAGMEGHLAAEEATLIAIAKAKQHGVSAVAVRRGHHSGVVGRYVRMAAEQGCACLIVSNAKPIMAAPGGAERLVGTNPLAIGIPAAEGPIVLDMATSAGTYGRIRQARALGQPIPEGWALDRDGNPTTDAAAGMAGLLLPMAGAKGFALAFAIDLMAGLFSSGGWGARLGSVDDDPSMPQNSSYLFIALDVAHFRELPGFLAEAQEAIERVRNSHRADGVERLFTPGERSAKTLAGNDGTILVATAVLKALVGRAGKLNVTVPDFLR